MSEMASDGAARIDVDDAAPGLDVERPVVAVEPAAGVEVPM